MQFFKERQNQINDLSRNILTLQLVKKTSMSNLLNTSKISKATIQVSMIIENKEERNSNQSGMNARNTNKIGL